MFACKDIFAKSSITQVCEAHVARRAKTCEARLSAYIISYFSQKSVNKAKMKIYLNLSTDETNCDIVFEFNYV